MLYRSVGRFDPGEYSTMSQVLDHVRRNPSLPAAPQRHLSKRNPVRLATAAALALLALVATAFQAQALGTTYGSQGNCNVPSKSSPAIWSDSISIQAFAAHKIQANFNVCQKFVNNLRPTPSDVAYVDLSLTAPSTNPGSPVESITIEAGTWLQISNGVRYQTTVKDTVVKVGTSTFPLNVDFANNKDYANMCFGKTCKHT